MLKSSLCDYSDAYIFVKGKVTITETGADTVARQADEKDKGVAFKNCARFTNCMREINNTQVDYRDEPDDNLADSESFKSKIKITGKTPDDYNEKDVGIMVPLKILK